MTWHTGTRQEVLAALGTTARGLSEEEANNRLTRFGRNELPRQRATPWWAVFVRQFASPLIVVLGVAAGLSLAIGHNTDAGFIVVVLVLNALIGGSQEWRAERSTLALRRLLQSRASVEREGEVREIATAEVVAGDVVWLEPGFRVPADGRLLSETGLEVDESLLTGESVPVDKDAGWVPGGSGEIALADQVNMVHAGTTVVRGRAKAVVTATGPASSIGRLAVDVAGAPAGRPPLLIRLERFSRLVGVVAVVLALVVAALGVVVAGQALVDMAIYAAALAVSIIPEGLPVAITIALAVASARMTKRGVVVRRLGAVEGLGSCTLIASDKTGTLTCNELTVREIRLASGPTLQVTGEGFTPVGEVHPAPAALGAVARAELESLAIVAVLCNEADLHHGEMTHNKGTHPRRMPTWVWRGDPTDIALLALGRKVGISQDDMLDGHPQMNQIPFEPERRFAASYHRFDGGTRVLVKGAPERVQAMCAGGEAVSGVRNLMAAAHDMAARGLRVLAMAEGEVRGSVDPSTAPPEPTGLRFLGLVGMIDPLRAGVREAVRACESAGVGVCMVTGDHPVTALAIARELGIAERAEQVVVGERLEGWGEDELRAAVGRVRVFARVAPGQKLRIVEAARAAGEFVAVTGDGANDAPALKAANIGVAMGRGGTDAARDASDLVISDDNFATIVAGIEEGRVAYDNIRKVIYLLLSTNGAEALMVVGAVAIGLPLPLLPVQLLWLNLATEGFQTVALAFEPKEDGVLRRPPRPSGESVFNRLMVERMVVGSLVMGGISLAAFWWMIHAGWATHAARNAVLLLMVLFENVQAGNSRSETRSALAVSPFRSPLLFGSVLLAVALHVGAMHFGPMQRIVGLAPVNSWTWVVLTLVAFVLLAAIEAHKLSWWLRTRG